MQPCFDFRDGFSCDICVEFRPIPRPQEKRSFSGQFKYKVQSFGSCICLLRNWHHAFMGSLHKSDIIVRFARTNGELTSHLKAVPSVETKNLLSTFLAINYPLIIFVRQTII